MGMMGYYQKIYLLEQQQIELDGFDTPIAVLKRQCTKKLYELQNILKKELEYIEKCSINLFFVSIPKIEEDLQGIGGLAIHFIENTYGIVIDVDYLYHYSDIIINEILAHELAHVAEFAIADEKSEEPSMLHDDVWKHYALLLGSSGEEFIKYSKECHYLMTDGSILSTDKIEHDYIQLNSTRIFSLSGNINEDSFSAKDFLFMERIL